MLPGITVYYPEVDYFPMTACPKRFIPLIPLQFANDDHLKFICDMFLLSFMLQ